MVVGLGGMLLLVIVGWGNCCLCVRLKCLLVVWFGILVRVFTFGTCCSPVTYLMLAGLYILVF